MEDLTKETYDCSDLSSEESTQLIRLITNRVKLFRYIKTDTRGYVRKFSKPNWKRNQPEIAALISKGYVNEVISKKGGNSRIYVTSKGYFVKDMLESVKEL